MTGTFSADGNPRRILLATDLSSRCDRALDRAAQLTDEWRAELIALNVLDPSTSPDQILTWVGGSSDEQLLATARRQLMRDIESVKVPAKLHISRSGDPPAAIRQMASDTQFDLVVAGVSRNDILGQLLLGSTVEKLARSLAVPLLVVHSRVHEPYQRIVVATDFSECSRNALLAAAQLFPKRELILYHAHGLSVARLADKSIRCGGSAVIAESECAAFLNATTLPKETKFRVVIEDGAVETMLTRYVREHEIDLVVIGSRGHGLMSLLLGSTAAKLLDWLPCDTLLVPTPPVSG